MTLILPASVITLDGPSGTGKGTISLMVADYLRWHYLDSGAIYRVLAYAQHVQAIPLEARETLVSLAHSLNLRFEIDEFRRSRVMLDNHDVTQLIRTEQCGQNASRIAVIPEVRQALLARQRAFAAPPGLVTDGRDMGTVVFPQALLKIYLFASSEARAGRRYLQLQDSGNNASLAQVTDELIQRDQRDEARDHAPLKPADDAVLIDTTGLTIVQVFDTVLESVNQRIERQTENRSG